MWDFNWGIFWALLAYGALKFGVKRALGLYGARVKQKQPRHKPFHVEYLHGKSNWTTQIAQDDRFVGHTPKNSLHDKSATVQCCAAAWEGLIRTSSAASIQLKASANSKGKEAE